MERHDPDPTGNERAILEQFLDYHRVTLLHKAEGLTADQLRQPLPTSSLTLAGLLKHLANVEDHWIQVRFLGNPQPDPWASAPWEDDPDWDLHSAVHDDPDALRALYRAACERTRQSLATANLDDLSVGVNHDGEQWNLRWILTHMVEETARHNGHADLLREAIDGSVGE